MSTANNVQAITLALFGAYGGGYSADLAESVDAIGVAAVADNLMPLQPLLLAVDLSDNAAWIDEIMGNLGIMSTSVGYDEAVAWASGRLEAGASRGTVVAEAIAYLMGDNVAADFAEVAAAFMDAVEAAVTWSEGTVGSESVGFAALRAVAGNPETGGVFNLTAALAALADAQDARSEFLAALDLDGDDVADGDAEGYDAEAQAEAVAEGVWEAAEALDNIIAESGAAADDTFYNADLGSAQQDALITAARALLEAAVIGADAVADAVQAEVDAVEGLQDLFDAYDAAVVAAEDAIAAAEEATADLAAAVAYAETKNSVDLDVDAEGVWVENGEAGSGFDAEVDDLIISYDAEAEEYAAAGELTDDDFEGLTDLVASVNTLDAAMTAAAEAVDAVEGAWEELDGAAEDSAALYEAAAESAAAATAAAEDLSDFEAAVDAFEEAVATAEALDELDTAVAEATDVVAGQYNVDPADANNDAEDAVVNDLFVFDAEAGDIAIDNFGDYGNDVIKVEAGAYTLVSIDAEGLDTTNGSASVLEIFVQDDGTDTFLYVEQNAFDGSSAAAQEDLIVIELTGVTDMDVVLTSMGYLSVK